jgi:hypothetical protein
VNCWCWAALMRWQANLTPPAPPVCLLAHCHPIFPAPPARPPAEAQRREVRALLLNRSKLLLAPASSAYKHSIK